MWRRNVKSLQKQQNYKNSRITKIARTSTFKTLWTSNSRITIERYWYMDFSFDHLVNRTFYLSLAYGLCLWSFTESNLSTANSVIIIFIIIFHIAPEDELELTIIIESILVGKLQRCSIVLLAAAAGLVNQNSRIELINIDRDLPIP